MRFFRIASRLALAVICVMGMFFVAAVILISKVVDGIVALWERGDKYYARRKD